MLADVDFSWIRYIPGIGSWLERWSPVYLYYDADCDGKGGGHPQWGTYYEPPDVTRSYDLDSNGKCVKGGALKL